MDQPDYAEDIETAIYSILESISDYGYCFERELHTRYWLVDPMLAALGWDVSDLSLVHVEYPTLGGKWVDYALLEPATGSPLVVIEAKAIWTREIRAWNAAIEPDDLKEWKQADVDQLKGYVSDLGLTTGYAVLTDGGSWDIYDLSIPGEFHEKRIHYFDILWEEPKVSVTKLMTLHRVNFAVRS